VVVFNGETPDLKKMLKKAKTFCASGGTVRENTIELQGEHKNKLRKLLIKEGIPIENIEIL
jgi:translation initiation factor 1